MGAGLSRERWLIWYIQISFDLFPLVGRIEFGLGSVFIFSAFFVFFVFWVFFLVFFLWCGGIHVISFG